jgi:hypothetical protein
MRGMNRSIQAAVMFAILAAGGATRGEEPNLFSGGDLGKHWKTKGNWKLGGDAVVTLEPRPGESGWTRYDSYLWLEGPDARDFTAEFDYQFQKGGNSGFYFHVGDRASPVATGIEVQLYDSGSKPADAKLTDHDSGGVIPGVPPKRNTAKPAGEWNAMKVDVTGGKLVVTLNGEVVNEVALDAGALAARPKTGGIGFQDHGLPLKLRNFRIVRK